MRAIRWMGVAAALLTAASVCAAEAQRTMSVQVRQGDLRKSPSFLGAVAASLAYGDRVAVLRSEGAWMEVASADGNRKGWIHSTALTPKRIVMEAGGTDAAVSASGGEIAMAGKGFNAGVEREFKERGKLDYAWVDRMAGFKVSAAQAQAFLAAGTVRPEKGGAR